MGPDNADGVQSPGTSLARLRAAAERQRSAPAWLWWLLDTTLSDEPRLNDVAARSSFHHNGFFKIVPAADGHPRLRLHIWPAGGPDQVGARNPHGHRWPFASWVITGSLQETTFAESNRGVPFGVFDYAGSTGPIPTQPSRRVLLAPAATFTRSAGVIYTRSTGELHVATPADNRLVATLVLQGADELATTPVYRRPGARPPQAGRTVSGAELRALLTEVIDVLEPVA